MNLPTIPAPITATHWSFESGAFYCIEEGNYPKVYVTRGSIKYWQVSVLLRVTIDALIASKKIVTLAELEEMKKAAANKIAFAEHHGYMPSEESYEAPWKDKINESKEQ